MDRTDLKNSGFLIIETGDTEDNFVFDTCGSK